MRPYLLQGHERPITKVCFNVDGDLLFTASKDLVPSVWYSDNGERLGTFNGHKGTVWDLEPDYFSERLLTASADASIRVWKIANGECVAVVPHKGPVRGVAWAEGGREFASISDSFMELNAKIYVHTISTLTTTTAASASTTTWDDDEDDNDDPNKNADCEVALRLEIDLPKVAGKKIHATGVHWTSMNEDLLVSLDTGAIRLYDPETGDLKHEFAAHDKKINRMRFNRDKTLLLTSSADCTAKLFDPFNHWKHLYTYKTDRPVNDAVMSPTKDHILLGGGQEAMSVTTTAGKVGKFETRFFHLVYQEEFGCVKGHFGPINALDIHPNGSCYASGAEDGYVRLHHFDKSYLDLKDPVPEEDEIDDDIDDNNDIEDNHDDNDNHGDDMDEENDGIVVGESLLED